MNFCTSCDSILELKVNDKKELIEKCNKCPYFIIKKDRLVCKKYYRESKCEEKYKNNFNNDYTLPSKESTCPSCNMTNINKYQKIYYQKKFFIQNICENCLHIF